jgi:hypothetical protein
MKNFLKDNWFKIILLIIIVAIINGAFYWFQWRPTRIRTNCLDKSRSDALYDIQASAEYPNMTTLQTAKEEELLMHQIYQNCLKENGLEK